MPRKKSNLSQHSNNARRTRLSRAKETEEERTARLDKARENKARSRASETSAQREERLSKQRAYCRSRKRNIKYGPSLSAEHTREARLAADRLRLKLSCESAQTADSLSIETEEEREARLETNRLRVNKRVNRLKQRLLQNLRGHDVRITKDRQNQNNAKAVEYDDQQQQRSETAEVNNECRC